MSSLLYNFFPKIFRNSLKLEDYRVYQIFALNKQIWIYEKVMCYVKLVSRYSTANRLVVKLLCKHSLSFHDFGHIFIVIFFEKIYKLKLRNWFIKKIKQITWGVFLHLPWEPQNLFLLMNRFRTIQCEVWCIGHAISCLYYFP